ENSTSCIDDVCTGLEDLQAFLALQGERPAHRPQHGKLHGIRRGRRAKLKGENCARHHPPCPGKNHLSSCDFSASRALSTHSFIRAISRPRNSCWQRSI